MNPLKHLLPALYSRLSDALLLDGEAVPVYEHLPGNFDGHYVLLQQPTHQPTGGSHGCKAWSCTALVDCITQFRGAISSAPVDELLDQLSDLLEDQRLPLPTNWDCGPATFEPSAEVRETDGELVLVRRLVRFRWSVYYHVPVLVEELESDGFDYVFRSGGIPFKS